MFISGPGEQGVEGSVLGSGMQVQWRYFEALRLSPGREPIIEAREILQCYPAQVGPRRERGKGQH